MNEFERDIVVAEFERFSGQTVPPSFLTQKRTNPAIKDKYQYHHLLCGIFKPKGTELALSILQILGGKYSDTLVEDPVLGWRLEYSRQASGARSWNAALERCMGVAPVVVIRQVVKRTNKVSSSYNILGLGRVDSYDESRGVFTITEWKGELVRTPVSTTPQDVASAEKKINASLAKSFSMFGKEKKFNAVQRQARDAAFRNAIIEYYDGTCVVCGSKWNVKGSCEVEAAHIVSKEENGADDPRNGFALCKFHHWAFDKGLFTINHDYEILVSEKAKQFSPNPEQVTQYAGKKIKMPVEPKAKPDPSAIAWHKEHVFIR